MKRFFSTAKRISIPHITKSTQIKPKTIDVNKSDIERLSSEKSNISNSYKHNLYLMHNEIRKVKSYTKLDVSKVEEKIKEEESQCYPGGFGQ